MIVDLWFCVKWPLSWIPSCSRQCFAALCYTALHWWGPSAVYLPIYTLSIQKRYLVLHECTVPKCLSLHWLWTSGEHGSLTLCALSPTEANCQEVQEETEHPRGCQGGGNRWWESRLTFTDLFKWLLQAHTCTWNSWKRLLCMCKGRFLRACTYLPGQSTWKGLYWVCTILLHMYAWCAHFSNAVVLTTK